METPGIEKRRVRRISSNPSKEIEFQTVPETEAHPAIMRDHSIQGMGFVTSQGIATGTRIIIHVKHSRKTAKINAQVLHATPMDEGKWLLGCEFASLLTADDF